MAEKQPTIQNFIASMNKSGGFARTARYAVIITPPTNLAAILLAASGTAQRDGQTLGFDGTVDALSFVSQNGIVTQQVNLHCSSVSMPGHDLQAQDVQHGSAPGRQMVTSHDYAGTIAATFYLDSHLRERHFFEKWQELAVSTSTHKANYYDDYVGTMEILQLDANGEITYGIKAIEVYPTTMAGIEYAYANTNTIATQAINFQYRQWYNMTSASIDGYRDSSRINYDAYDQSDRTVQVQKRYGALDIETTSSAVREKQLEKSRQKHLRPPEVDLRSSFGKKLQSGLKRQEQLRPPEIDRRAAGRTGRVRQAKRREQLRSPNSKASTRRGR